MVHNASRRIVHFNVTTNPAPEWAALQVLQAFPWDTAPKFLLRDRDSIYAIPFTSQGEAMGIEQDVTAVRSPWQNSYIERLIGTVRRECLDHVIVLGERHLSRILRQYIEYYPSIHTSCHFDPQAPWQERIPPRRNALGHVCGYQQRRRVARCSI